MRLDQPDFLPPPLAQPKTRPRRTAGLKKSRSRFLEKRKAVTVSLREIRAKKMPSFQTK